jgi:hypothetical protein
MGPNSLFSIIILKLGLALDWAGHPSGTVCGSFRSLPGVSEHRETRTQSAHHTWTYLEETNLFPQ